MSTTSNHQPDGPPAAFVTTQWTRVLSARGDSPEAKTALSDLCGAYYAPVLAFIRHRGHNDDSAREFTQEFFARLLAGHGLDAVEQGCGRFRSYLLGAVKHFLAHEYHRARAAKRGSGQTPIALATTASHETTAELQPPDPASPVPDAFFDRQWALTVVDRALAKLAAEYGTRVSPTAPAAKGASWAEVPAELRAPSAEPMRPDEDVGARQAQRATLFETLKPWLLGDLESLSQADAAGRLGLSEGAVKVAIHRLRKRFRELVKGEIAHTVGNTTQVQEELGYLLEALSQA